MIDDDDDVDYMIKNIEIKILKNLSNLFIYLFDTILYLY